MFCTNCGQQLPEGTKFCTSCGAPTGAAASVQETVRMPSPAPAPASTQPMSPAPVPPADARQILRDSGGEPPRQSKAPIAAAVVLALLAVAALAAVVVFADPFGLDLLGKKEPEAQEQPAGQDEGAQEDGRADADEKDDADAATPDEDPEPADDPDPTPEPEEDPEPADEPEKEPEEEPDEEDEPEDEEPEGTYVLADSSTHLYTTDELEGMSEWELYIARNEIYARHGRRFRNEDLQSYFNGQPWYEPRYDPDEFDEHASDYLNETERKNADTILALEKSIGSSLV